MKTSFGFEMDSDKILAGLLADPDLATLPRELLEQAVVREMSTAERLRPAFQNILETAMTSMMICQLRIDHLGQSVDGEFRRVGTTMMGLANRMSAKYPVEPL